MDGLGPEVITKNARKATPLTIRPSVRNKIPVQKLQQKITIETYHTSLENNKTSQFNEAIGPITIQDENEITNEVIKEEAKQPMKIVDAKESYF